MDCRYFDATRNGSHSNFLTPTLVDGRCAVPCQIFAESEPPPPFEKRRVRHISAYNVSTAKDSEKSSIMTNIKWSTGFPMSNRWSEYVTPNSRKGGSKSDFSVFLDKSQIQSNKVCYKVSLCENFQRRSCSMAISLSDASVILARKVTL